MVCHALTIVDADSNVGVSSRKDPASAVTIIKRYPRSDWVLVIVFQHRFNGPGIVVKLHITDTPDSGLFKSNIFIPEAGLIFTSANLSGSRR